ncbi:hypothetical protein SAMN02746009_03536 [Hymenobacter psychrotolerans DSM 18569]|uniref:Uncharacterized protein n=1 Tax=Hymenobacter psychrotolerans DSM 18569 TaxID=1121959 RepID=A0A1M7E6X7_9BACT|nr:hypothetical protein SAMN02746009_03536 [Hymenobacter psychrotolerans DSM 18569]
MDLSKLQSLGGLNGEDNTPGLLNYVLWAATDWFETIAKAPKYSAAAPAGTSAIIATAHAFKPGFGFIRIYLTLDSSELKGAVVGERDGRGQKLDLEGFHPGNRPEALEFFNIVKNIDGIMLVPDPEYNYIQVGADGLPVELAPAYGSGKISGGRKGITVKAECYATGIKIYKGDVLMKPDNSVNGAQAPSGT